MLKVDGRYLKNNKFITYTALLPRDEDKPKDAGKDTDKDQSDKKKDEGQKEGQRQR